MINREIINTKVWHLDCKANTKVTWRHCKVVLCGPGVWLTTQWVSLLELLVRSLPTLLPLPLSPLTALPPAPTSSSSPKQSWLLIASKEYQHLYIKWVALLLDFVFFVFVFFSVQFQALGDNLNTDIFLTAFYGNLGYSIPEKLFLMLSYERENIHSKIFSIFRPLKSQFSVIQNNRGIYMNF